MSQAEVQTDPQGISGTADMAGCKSEEQSHPLHGVVAPACTQAKRTQHGKPQSLVGDDQPDVREGEATGVAKRFTVPMKPDNAGEEKGTSAGGSADIFTL
jgi:hypothetical protein